MCVINRLRHGENWVESWDSFSFCPGEIGQIHKASKASDQSASSVVLALGPPSLSKPVIEALAAGISHSEAVTFIGEKGHVDAL